MYRTPKSRINTFGCRTAPEPCQETPNLRKKLTVWPRTTAAIKANVNVAVGDSDDGRTGLPVDAGWKYVGSECRDPSDQGPVEQRRALTTQDVISAVRRLGAPAATAEAPPYTLVNLETTFFTRPTTVDRDLTIIGYSVDVHIEPSSYTWQWGDGTTSTSETAGRPYPAKDVTHTYLQATEPSAPLALSVDVTYQARYRVDGGPWQTIPDVLTIPGPPTALPVKQASAVLVAGD